MGLFTNVYYRYLKFPSEFKNQKGITAIGNAYHNSLIIRAVRNGRYVRNRIVRANEYQKTNEDEILKLERFPMLENDKFHSTKRNMRWQFALFSTLLTSEIGLNIFTARIIVPAYDLRGPLWDLIRLAIAIAVTVTATWACDKFLQVVLDKSDEESIGRNRITKLIIYLMIFGFAEVVIAYFGLVRAKDLEGNNQDVTTAMTILAMIVPLVAGAIWWNINDLYDEYKNRLNYDQRLNRRMQLISAIKALQEWEIVTFKEQSNAYWHTFLMVRTYKENFNFRKNITEQITDDHLKDFDHFSHSAFLRYNDRISAKA
jgi:hypothetical protein